MARTRGHKSHEMKAEAVATKQRLVGKAFHQGLRGHSLARKVDQAITSSLEGMAIIRARSGGPILAPSRQLGTSSP